jgi:hypothetical protein
MQRTPMCKQRILGDVFASPCLTRDVSVNMATAESRTYRTLDPDLHRIPHAPNEEAFR